MEYKSFVDKMKLSQLLYNLEMSGNKPQSPDNNLVEDWASKIFEDNKELFEKTSEEQFINYVLYGK